MKGFKNQEMQKKNNNSWVPSLPEKNSPLEHSPAHTEKPRVSLSIYILRLSRFLFQSNHSNL